MASTTRIPYASFPLSPLASSPRLHQALSPTRSPFPGPLPPPSGLEAPSPSSPLPELLRGYQHALATEQQASHAIEELHREIAELVEMQLNLQKMGSKSQSQSYGRQPADAADHARRLAVCQIQLAQCRAKRRQVQSTLDDATSLVRRLHESLFLYEFPDPVEPSVSPLECHVHSVLTRYHRTFSGSANGSVPHTEALTLIGAALKYNGLSYEQGYRSCCNAHLSGGTGSPTAFLGDDIEIKDFISFAIDMLDPYLPSEACAVAMELVVTKYFDPLSTGRITFENWSLSLLIVDDAALQLARDFKSRVPHPLHDSSSSFNCDESTLIFLIPLPVFPAPRLPPELVVSHPLPKILSAESEAQMLLNLVSGERAADGFEATTSADNHFHVAKETTRRNSFSSGTTPVPSTGDCLSANSVFQVQSASQPFQAGLMQRSPSPAGSIESTASEAQAFTDGWDKSEWKLQRRLGSVSGSGFALDKKKEQEHTLQQIKHSDEARQEKHKRLAQDIATSLLQQQQLMQQRRLRANVALISTKRASPQTPRISAGRRQEELLPSSEKINMTQQRPHGQFRDASKLLLSTLSDISLASSSPSPSSLYRRSRRVTPSS